MAVGSGVGNAVGSGVGANVGAGVASNISSPEISVFSGSSGSAVGYAELFDKSEASPDD